MAVANFFERTLMSASQAIRGIEPAVAEARLADSIIEVVYDESARESGEGRHALDMAIRLLARLYPAIRVIGDADGDTFRQGLEDLATSINPSIDLRPRRKATARLVFGSQDPGKGPPSIFVGSDGWIAKVGASPEGFGSSNLPFGAGAAACLGCANLFRLTFANELNATIDADARLSLFDFSTGLGSVNGPKLFKAALDDIPLVGVGAIGNGVVWALSRSANLVGALHLVDPEAIELSNLQRYVLPGQREVDRQKTIVGKEAFGKGKLEVKAFPVSFARYVADQGHRPIARVVVALDSAADRIGVQSALPRRAHNAWTQPGDLGVSRHDFLGPEACLACLYMPQGGRPNHDQLIAAALAWPTDPDSLRVLREMLANGQPVGELFVRQVAANLGILPDSLLVFADQPLESFYVKAVCGGLTLEAVGNRPPIEAPLAFQSALAGIMLAADLIVEVAGLRAPLPTKTVVDVLRPVGSRLNVRVLKPPADAPAPCICTDADFIKAYCDKHGMDVPAPLRVADRGPVQDCVPSRSATTGTTRHGIAGARGTSQTAGSTSADSGSPSTSGDRPR
ncbi:E2 ligase fold family C protein [Parablastomonas sp. CN1-191]|uniref:E2 ligase fold family C protein n=1 Tax=Parablastomonas sp. CN1-191 TaxID=3400908 RepID=UPI003BF819EF